MWIPGGNDAVTSSPRTTSTPSDAPSSIAATELGHRVVIGDAEHVEPDGRSSANQLLGADHPVARQRVRVDLREAEPVRRTRARIGPSGSSLPV